jgi:hypothetical protein
VARKLKGSSLHETIPLATFLGSRDADGLGKTTPKPIKLDFQPSSKQESIISLVCMAEDKARHLFSHSRVYDPFEALSITSACGDNRIRIRSAYFPISNICVFYR